MRKNKHAALRKRTYPLDKRTTREAHEGRNMSNRKPFRTAHLRQLAASTAEKGKDGTYRSNAPVRHHPEVR